MVTQFVPPAPAAPDPTPRQRDLTLAHLFEAQVDRSPHAAAVVDGERVLTFAQLEERANRLAHRLSGWGVGPEPRVALLLPRSVDSVVARLAVAKAGGAFLPIDPAYPAGRITAMLEDARPTVLI